MPAARRKAVTAAAPPASCSTISLEVLSLTVSISASRYSFHTPRKLKIVTVVTPGAASGSSGPTATRMEAPELRHVETPHGEQGQPVLTPCRGEGAAEAPQEEQVKEEPEPKPKVPLFLKARPAAAAAESSAANWPSFRGKDAAGVADGQDLPDEWNAEKGENIRWKKRIPGLAHSSPVIWGDRLFVTSAISSKADASFKPGLYGDPAADADNSKHRWMVYCLDKKSGKTIWESLATDGSPREKRHIKATFANSSPVTDGRYLVAFFGSQGLFGFDLDGKKLWSKDLGRLDAGAHDLPEYEWGTASSPVIYGDLVIVQCDCLLYTSDAADE